MTRQFVGVLSLIVLATGVMVSAGAEDYLTPPQAIQKAAYAAPASVGGTFDMQVRTTGQAGFVYLNSESDYRDQRNVTVVISPFVRAALLQKFGQAPEVYFLGKHIRVTGEAKRVTIRFYSNGVQTDKYYFQTHIDLADASQIQVVQ